MYNITTFKNVFQYLKTAKLSHAKPQLLITSLSLLISFILSLFFFLDVFHQRFINFISSKSQLSFIDLFTCFSVSISIISFPSLLFFCYELQVLFVLFILIPLGIRLVCLFETVLFVCLLQVGLYYYTPPCQSFFCSASQVLEHCVFIFNCLEIIFFNFIFDFFKEPFVVQQHVVSEKAMALHSSTLAWKIPWMEEPGRLQSTGSQRVGDD